MCRRQYLHGRRRRPHRHGLKVALCGEDVAKLIQLQIEYDPKPPFPAVIAGHVRAPWLVERYLALSEARRAAVGGSRRRRHAL